MTGSPNDRAVTRAHDIGLWMMRQGDAAGFEVMVGGGLGRTPMMGKVLREFLPVSDLLPYAPEDLRNYMDRHDLLRHPLVARGYPSIGCAPCTTPAAAGENPRAGCWRGNDKTECGIHIEGGRVVKRAS